MNFRHVRRVLAVLTWLGTAVSTAHAAVFVGHFDPAFGPAVPNLGFRGSSFFSVPDACLSQTGFVSNTNACSGGAMQNLSTTVEFYNTNAPLVTLATQVFADQALVDVLLNSGTLGGVDSQTILAQNVHVLNTDNSTLFAGDLWLQFKVEALMPKAYLYTCDPATTCATGTQSNPASMTLATAPEPGSIALAMLALGAAGVAGRRQRRIA